MSSMFFGKADAIAASLNTTNVTSADAWGTAYTVLADIANIPLVGGAGTPPTAPVYMTLWQMAATALVWALAYMTLATGVNVPLTHWLRGKLVTPKPAKRGPPSISAPPSRRPSESAGGEPSPAIAAAAEVAAVVAMRQRTTSPSSSGSTSD